MRRFQVVVLVLVLALSAAGQRRFGRGGRGVAPGSQEFPPQAASESERRILGVMQEAENNGALFSNVPAADGRILRILTETSNAKTVVEIGTSTGISGLWFLMGLEKTGGRLHTFEIDAGRAATAAAHFKKAGVDRLVNLVQGDAHENIKRLKDPIDIVFIDAEKEGYVDYLRTLLPLVRPGGLILAHNTDMVSDYLKAVAANSALETVIFSQAGGLSITLKKR